jgi:hypothetical protein
MFLIRLKIFHRYNQKNLLFLKINYFMDYNIYKNLSRYLFKFCLFFNCYYQILNNRLHLIYPSLNKIDFYWNLE